MAPSFSRDELSAALAASLYWSGSGLAPSAAASASLGWLRAAWEAGEDHMPLSLVHDLGHLLLLGRDFVFASTLDLEAWPEDEREVRSAYEDRYLGRWAIDPSVRDAHVRLAGTPPAYRPAAVAHAIVLALGTALRTSGALEVGNVAVLRAISEPLVASLPDRFEGWSLDAAWVAWARDRHLSALAVLSPARLFRPEDLWEIAHFAELPLDSARMALRELHREAGRIGPVSPAVVMAARGRAREIVVDANDADLYPAGGFDAVSTRGSFENMVRTEVAYVGEGASEGIDLFDVRYAERELLFYTRDESPLLDARREVVFIVDRPSELRYKVAALGAQTLVFAEALALALVADFARAFGASGWSFALRWRAPTSDDGVVADEERALVALTLAPDIAHGRVTLAVVSSFDEVGRGERIVVSPRPPADDVPYLEWVRAGDERWETSSGAGFDLRDGNAALRSLADLLVVASAGRASPLARRRGRGAVS